MSAESSAVYYSLINKEIRQRLGGHHNAKSIMVTVDFAEVETHMRSGQWDRVATLMIGAAKKLEQTGAECVVLCTNTIHKIASAIESEVSIPLLNLIDATGLALTQSKIRKAGLIGTSFTMEDGFYQDRLADRFEVSVIVPDAADREIVHRVIFEELTQGIMSSRSKSEFVRIVGRLKDQGAEGVVLGCTEIPMLIGQEDASLPLFDTTEIHVRAAVEFSLA